MNDPKAQPMFERHRDLEDPTDGPDVLSAIEVSEKGKAPLVGTGSMVGHRPSRAEVREAVVQGKKVAAALRALAAEEGITFLELLRRIAELPNERQPRSNAAAQPRPANGES